jgi:hypothetical protein
VRIYFVAKWSISDLVKLLVLLGMSPNPPEIYVRGFMGVSKISV